MIDGEEVQLRNVEGIDVLLIGARDVSYHVFYEEQQLVR